MYAIPNVTFKLENIWFGTLWKVTDEIWISEFRRDTSLRTSQYYEHKRDCSDNDTLKLIHFWSRETHRETWVALNKLKCRNKKSEKIVLFIFSQEHLWVMHRSKTKLTRVFSDTCQESAFRLVGCHVLTLIHSPHLFASDETMLRLLEFFY